VLRAAVAALALAGTLWYVRVHRPAAAALADREREVAVREARAGSARAAASPRPDADGRIHRLRADSMRLATRVPTAYDAAVASAPLKDALGHLERRAGVRVTATEPLPAGAEGPFSTGGYRVTVVGRYEEVGVLLAELASLERLTAIRGLRLHAVPDSLVRGARPYAAAGAGAALPPADSAGAAAALADAGEPPFHATAMFDVLWFTRPPASHAPEGPSGAAGAGPLPGGDR
jgi:hypothetical protein